MPQAISPSSHARQVWIDFLMSSGSTWLASMQSRSMVSVITDACISRISLHLFIFFLYILLYRIGGICARWIFLWLAYYIFHLRKLWWNGISNTLRFLCPPVRLWMTVFANSLRSDSAPRPSLARSSTGKPCWVTDTIPPDLSMRQYGQVLTQNGSSLSPCTYLPCLRGWLRTGRTRHYFVFVPNPITGTTVAVTVSVQKAAVFTTWRPIMKCNIMNVIILFLRV